MSINLPKMLAPSQGLALRQGVVTGTPDNINLTCSVFIAGNDTAVSLKYMAHVAPVSGDPVWIMQNGTDMLVVGKTKTGAGGTQSASIFGDGLELYHSASTPYIDFHRAANPAGDSNADYNIRFINDATDTIHIAAGSGGRWGHFHIGNTPNACVGAYGWDSNWAHFGCHEAFAASNGYAFMSHSGGDTIVSGRGTTYIRAQSAADRMTFNNECHTSVRLNVTGGIMVWSDWVRVRNSEGLYFENRGGGWNMPGNDWVESYPGGKNVYSGGIIRAGDAYIQTWANAGGHAVISCWGAANSKGWMVRNDGNSWAMYETQFFCRGNDGGDYFNFYRFGDIRLNVPTVPPGDPDLRIANSHQLLRNASNRRLKKNIRPITEEPNPVWDIEPVLYHWKDDAREHGHRFNQRHPKGCPGFIAEDLYDVAPSACTVDTMTGEPNGPDNWALLAYVIAGLKELKGKVDKLEKK